MSAVMKPRTMIRQAKSEDIDRMIAFAKGFWDQTTYAESVEYDIDTMVDTTKAMIDTDVVLYAEDEGEIVGLLSIMISPFPMNRNIKSAVEWGFYVHEQYRSGGLGVKLLECAEAMLKERGVKFFTMIALENLKPKAVGRFYRRLGFAPEETCYMKELK